MKQSNWYRLSFVAACMLGSLSACGGGGSSGSTLFTPFSTDEAVSTSARVVVSGKWLVFQADEATIAAGTNLNVLNGDADTTDSIAVVVNMVSKAETVLGVAAVDFAVVGAHVYLEVDENLDGFDWNNDADTSDVVLCHWPTTGAGLSSPAAADVEYVDDLEDESNQNLLEVDGRLYYARSDSTAGLVNGDTTLAYLETTAPVTPVAITAVDTAFVHHPRILRAEEDLLFLYEDETVETLDLNGDADTTDEVVLALLDGTDSAALVASVELALRDDSTPLRARNVAANDWNVGFLVNEAEQGTDVNGLNDANLFPGGWKPDNCPTYTDTDTGDDVLHFLLFKDWLANPITDPPVNTGLTGRDQIVFTAAVVGTISDEGDEGGGACDLNDDGDFTDEIVRWVKIATPDAPEGNDALLVAVADSTPGGASGLTDLNGMLLAVIDEGEDDGNYDANAADNVLLAWIDPVSPVAWTADHSSTSTLFFGVPWLGEARPHDYVRVAFQESVFAQNIGGSADSAFGNDDGDTTDSLPGLALFATPGDLDFYWPKVATSAINAGVAVHNNVLFFRISEAADKTDWNGDGDKLDTILARTALNGSNFLSLGTANDITDRAAVEGGGSVGAAWIANEAEADKDYNKDGDKTDQVLRWCRIG
ncbi:MAG: hypothetical protein HZA52_02780 [Planctomycetes bacterium]|nr:hypothetical protein [Planctomycetota bacterium]